MTERNRNFARITSQATQPALLPALVPPKTGNAAQDSFNVKVAETLDVREGRRGNPWEKSVTKRDLVDMGLISGDSIRGGRASKRGKPESGVGIPMSNGEVLSFDAFGEKIRTTKLYADLTRSIDDPARFAALPQLTRELLSQGIAEVDGKIEAFVRRSEQSFADASGAFAQDVEQLRASVARAAAGVRQVRFASANENRATSGIVTQVTAGLQDMSGVVGEASVEDIMIAVADRWDGLRAQRTIKVAANGAMAGIGLAATDDGVGNATSQVIIMADDFAIVGSGDVLGGTGVVGDPFTPPAGRVPFGVDTVNNTIYMNGTVRIGSGTGISLDSVTNKRIQLSFAATQFHVDSGGTPTPTDIAITATNLNGLTGAVSWSIITGTGTLTGSGTSSPSTRTIAYADMVTPLITVRASVTDGSETYTADVTITVSIDGIAGVAGTRTAVLDLYQWAATTPVTFPSGTSTYTWATGAFTSPGTLNGWTTTPGAAVLGQTLYIARQILTDTSTAPTSVATWTTTSARPLGAAGVNGTRTAFLELYRWSATAPVTFPAGSSTYTWATGAFTLPATPNSWSLTPGAAVAGQVLWGCAMNFADALTTATSSVTWSTTTAYPVGAAGTDGNRGSLIGYASSYGIRSSVWEDQKASRIIHNIVNGASLTTDLASTTHLKMMDTVTLTNASPWLYTKGIYAAGTAYVRGDLVVNTGATAVYRCILASTGNAVTNTTYFVLYASVVNRSTWANTTAYVMNDIVTGVDLGGVSTRWLCLYAHTSTGTFATERDGGGYLETRYWTGSAWVRPGVIIDGNLAVLQNITGGANIDIYGKAVFNGAYDDGTFDMAVQANASRVAEVGVFAYAGVSGTAVYGAASGSGAAGTGVYGLTSTGIGVGGTASGAAGTGVFGLCTNASGIGVHAAAGLLGTTGTALKVTGPMTMSSKTLVANLNSEFANGIKFGSATTGAATATLTLTNKPGSAGANAWLPLVDTSGATLGYLMVWA